MNDSFEPITDQIIEEQLELLGFTSPDNVQFKTADELGRKIAAQRAVCKQKKEEHRIENRKLEELEGQMLVYLNHFRKTSYDVAGVGTLYITTRSSVLIPRSPEDKKALLSWLRSKGEAVYLDKVSVNAQTLNSLYNEEHEIAEREGSLDTFFIPGVGAPKKMQVLSLRKGK